MPKICGIYLLTSPAGKMYVGQTVNLTHRMIAYRKLECDRQPKLFNSLAKHGFEAHTLTILRECSRAELDYWEVFYINVYDTFESDHGLNLTSGGRKNQSISFENRERLRRPRSPEIIAKIKATRALNKKPVSEETRAKMRANNLGRKHTEESKKKMSIASKNRKHSQATKDLLSQLNKTRPRKRGYTPKPSLTRGANVSRALKGNSKLHSVAKVIYCKDPDGLVLKFFKVKDCQEVIGVCSKSVWDSRTTGKPVKGYYFSFKPFDL